MAARIGRVVLVGGSAVVLIAMMATTSTAVEPGGSGATMSQAGAPEIRLDVPTSVAYDPLAEISGGQVAAMEPGPAAAPWTDLPDLPTPVFDNRIGLSYTLGGNDGTQVLAGMLRYREAVGDWFDDDVDIPGPRQAPAIGRNLYGEMVMAGGWDENGEPSATTHYYDDGSTEWVYELDEMPSPRAAAGSASFLNDPALYVIGGCTTADCSPVADSVFLLEDWYDEWSTVQDYPERVAFPSCGAWQRRIYCTGGHNGAEGIADSYVYDPRTDRWSPLPDPPTDSWGTQHAMVDGTLIVNGGVQGGSVTNNTFGYDVRAGMWVDLPNSTSAGYRGAGGCLLQGSQDSHFIKVGGLNGSDAAVARAEILPGFNGCGDGVGVPDVSRYAGSNRYGTGAAIAALYPEPQDTVFVTAGEDFPDALSAAARAGSLGAPMLMTRRDSLRLETRAELQRLAPESVVVVGGPAAVSDDVVELIEDVSGAASVRRLTGQNRYETSAAVAAEVQTADTVFIATGVDFPDALAASARAGALDAPLLLVKPDEVPAATLAQLDRLSPERIVLLGGNAAISDAVATQLGSYGTVERIAGANRWQTAALVAAEFSEAELVGVASGRTWPDALTGAARVGGLGSPLILVDTDRVPEVTRAGLRRLGPDVIEVYGGTNAVSQRVFGALEALYDG